MYMDDGDRGGQINLPCPWYAYGSNERLPEMQQLHYRHDLICTRVTTAVCD